MRASRLQELRSAAESDPENIDKWFELGKYAGDRFIVGTSEDALANVVKHRPEDPEVLALLAKALNRRRHLTEAEKVYKRALENEQENPELLTGLSVVYMNRGDMEKASEFCQKALAVDPGYPWAVHSYVAHLDQHGQPEEIERVLLKALEANPESPLIMINYAQFLMKHRSDAAQSFLEKALKNLEKADPEEQSRTMRILAAIRSDLALTIGSQLLQKDPDNVDIVVVVAVAHSQSNPQKAIEMLKGVLHEDPRNMRTMDALMGLYAMTGNMSGLSEMRKQRAAGGEDDGVLALTDMTLSVHDIQGTIASDEKRKALIESTRGVLQRHPKDAGQNITYLGALLSDDQVEEARKQLRHILDNVPLDNVKQVLLLGSLLRVSGMLQEAEQVYAIAKNLARTPLQVLLVELTEDAQNERYSVIADHLARYVHEEEAVPSLYAILGRVQTYTGHPDARENLHIAARVKNHDAMILLASVLMKEDDKVQARSLLEQVVSSHDADPLDKARALLALGQREEAIRTLEDMLRSRPADADGWLILALTRKEEGESAVREVVRRMVAPHTSQAEPSRLEDVLRRTANDRAAIEATNEVMTGIAPGKLKHRLLMRQIDALFREGFEDGER